MDAKASLTADHPTDGGPCENTDRHLWPDTAPHDAPHERIFVTAQGGIGIDVAGCVFVKRLRDWHNLAGGMDAFSIRKAPQPLTFMFKAVTNGAQPEVDGIGILWEVIRHMPIEQRRRVLDYICARAFDSNQQVQP